MDYRTKEEQVADYLRERIISGVYPRGSRLKQAEIAEELKLSITPVREALKLLEAEGYISGDSYRGARVVPFDVAASAEILNLRLQILDRTPLRREVAQADRVLRLVDIEHGARRQLIQTATLERDAVGLQLASPGNRLGGDNIIARRLDGNL